MGDAKKGLQYGHKALGRINRARRPGAAGERRLYDGCACNIDIDEDPVKPQKAIWELRKALASDAFVGHGGRTEPDVGGPLHEAQASQPVRDLRRNAAPWASGSGSIGVKYAHRASQVVDSPATAASRWSSRSWPTAMSEDLPVVVCLLNNGW